MNLSARTSAWAALGLFVCLLSCKKFTGGDDKKPTTGPTSEAVKPTSKPSPGQPQPATTDGELPSEMPLPGVYLIGKDVQMDGLKVKIAEVKECKYDRDVSQKSMEDAGDKLVGILIYYEGDYAEKDVRAYESTWKGYDAEGITFQRRSTYKTDCKPLLKHARLAKGDKAKGWIGFRVPAATKVFTAKYTYQTPNRPTTGTTKQIATFQVLGE